MEETLGTIFSEFQGKREEIIPILQKVQDELTYLPEYSMREIARFTHVPESDVYGVATFYTQFSLQPTGKTNVRICTSPMCTQAGSHAALQAARQYDGVKTGETTGQYNIDAVECLGLCDHAPAALVNEIPVARVDLRAPQTWIETPVGAPLGYLGGGPRWLTCKCGQIDPIDLDEFQANGGYSGLKKALAEMQPAEVIAQIEQSGLAGRGGAAFPTGLKWKFTAGAPGEPKYVVCNADESEPGTFKDRILLEGDPYQVLEGMTIAAYAIGAHHGYIYLRSEYPRAKGILQTAIDTARSMGFLGSNILNSGFDFEVEIHSGAGAYICGEETALFESIEGKRGNPRHKPPFPTTHGLFGKPTMINNVETLCTAAWIITNGSQAYRAVGTEKSPGTKLFCLSGDIGQPGVYEIPFGTPLRTLLEMAGGVDGELQAILIGGAAGCFMGPSELDIPLSFESLKEAGLPLGSGVVSVINTRQDLCQYLLDLAHFFTHESCGKCFPCQLGTRQQLEIITKVAAGEATKVDIRVLEEVGQTMRRASLCGLGQTASSAILSALGKWPQVFL